MKTLIDKIFHKIFFSPKGGLGRGMAYVKPKYKLHGAIKPPSEDKLGSSFDDFRKKAKFEVHSK